MTSLARTRKSLKWTHLRARCQSLSFLFSSSIRLCVCWGHAYNGHRKTLYRKSCSEPSPLWRCWYKVQSQHILLCTIQISIYSTLPTLGGTYVQDWTQSQKFASKLFSQCWQKRFIGNCCPKCMEEIANISRITNSTRIARLRYLQVSVSENFLVNHFFAKIAKKNWLANLCDCVKSWTYLLGWWGQSKRARPSCSKGE